ncbi:MAG TPA: hypothetical protein PKO22_11935, partial [Treponemataceae bacterium]|nr:hypothetical protein [Treponemataceae bacterium]
MKKLTGLIILAALAVMLSGCVINVGYGDYTFDNESDQTITVTVEGGSPSWFILNDGQTQKVKMSKSELNYDWSALNESEVAVDHS